MHSIKTNGKPEYKLLPGDRQHEKLPSALSRLKIGVLGNGWHTQSLRWVWFFLRISHALRKASERATQKSNLDKALASRIRIGLFIRLYHHKAVTTELHTAV
jgi:hypothetical protein